MKTKISLVLSIIIIGSLSCTTQTKPDLYSSPAPEVHTITSSFSRIVVVRLKNGTDLLEGLQKAVEKEKIKNAVILSGIGSLTDYHVHTVGNRTFPPEGVFMKDDTPNMGKTGDDLTFSTDVVDNMNELVVTVEYWFGDAQHFITTLTGTDQFSLTIDVPVDSISVVHYQFHARDPSNNMVSSIVKEVLIADDDIPEMVTDATATTGVSGEKFTFFTSIDDNIRISTVKVEYWLGEGSPINDTMLGTNPYVLTVDIPDFTGTLHYRFHATF